MTTRRSLVIYRKAQAISTLNGFNRQARDLWVHDCHHHSVQWARRWRLENEIAVQRWPLAQTQARA